LQFEKQKESQHRIQLRGITKQKESCEPVCECDGGAPDVAGGGESHGKERGKWLLNSAFVEFQKMFLNKKKNLYTGSDVSQNKKQ